MDSTRPSDTRALDPPHGIGRASLAAALILLVGASWAYLVYEDWAMRHMDVVDMMMPSAGDWQLADLSMVFVMWAVMMVGMMLPSVTPTLFGYRRIVAGHGGNPAALSGIFLAGYILAWTGFSVAATLGQWALHTALVLPGMESTSSRVSAALLILAGVYQWTPFKGACLTKCRSPLHFLLSHWRKGAAGALRMGLAHGLICTGCCWLLMAVLFVVGVMNLWWIGAITAFVLLEKVTPHGLAVSRVAGVLLIGWGVRLAVMG